MVRLELVGVASVAEATFQNSVLLKQAIVPLIVNEEVGVIGQSYINLHACVLGMLARMMCS